MSLLDTLLTAYMYENSKNSDPKITTAPSTPGEQFLLDQYKNAINNPSPTRQMATSAAQQVLGNMGSFNPSSFSFVSPIMQGQTFAGGMKLPSFDFSKIDMTKGFGTGGSSGGTTPTSTNPGATAGTGGASDPANPGAIGGIPAAPQYPDSNPTTGNDILNWLGSHGGAIQGALGMAGVPTALTNWLMTQIASGMASGKLQGATPLQSPTLNQWANQPQTPIQLPTNTPNYPDLTPGGGGGGSDPQLPTQQPYIPSLTPKT